VLREHCKRPMWLDRCRKRGVYWGVGRKDKCSHMGGDKARDAQDIGFDPEGSGRAWEDMT
jgi:hypothetical protein